MRRCACFGPCPQPTSTSTANSQQPAWQEGGEPPQQLQASEVAGQQHQLQSQTWLNDSSTRLSYFIFMPLGTADIWYC